MASESGTRRTEGVDYSLRTVKTGDQETEVAVQHFGDTLFVVITQLQKIGTLIHIVPDTPVAGETTSSFKVKVLMGAQAHRPEVHAFCQWFARKIQFDGKSLLLSLAVRDWTSTMELRPVADTVATLLSETRR